jgi:hypothetical protein
MQILGSIVEEGKMLYLKNVASFLFGDGFFCPSSFFHWSVVIGKSVDGRSCHTKRAFDVTI